MAFTITIGMWHVIIISVFTFFSMINE